MEYSKTLGHNKTHKNIFMLKKIFSEFLIARIC